METLTGRGPTGKRPASGGAWRGFLLAGNLVVMLDSERARRQRERPGRWAGMLVAVGLDVTVTDHRAAWRIRFRNGQEDTSGRQHCQHTARLFRVLPALLMRGTECVGRADREGAVGEGERETSVQDDRRRG